MQNMQKTSPHRDKCWYRNMSLSWREKYPGVRNSKNINKIESLPNFIFFQRGKGKISIKPKKQTKRNGRCKELVM